MVGTHETCSVICESKQERLIGPYNTAYLCVTMLAAVAKRR